MSDTKLHVRKATMLLREDHKKVKHLLTSLARLGANTDAQKSQLFEQIRREIGVHTQIEEEIFYPAVGMANDPRAAQLVREAGEEHHQIKVLIEELSKLSGTEEAFGAKIQVLRENVFNHAKKEEREIFPVFDKLDREEKYRISERLDSRKHELSPES